MSFLNKIKDLVAKNPGAVNTAIDKAGDIVDAKTKNKYVSQVDKAQEAAKKAVNKPPTQQAPTQPSQPAQQPPATP